MVVVFRALGFVADRDVLEHIVYDTSEEAGDKAMMNLLKPSLEEAFVIQDQDVALDYIGKRGSVIGATKEKRIKYAKDLLLKEFLPHVGGQDVWETRKVCIGAKNSCAYLSLVGVLLWLYYSSAADDIVGTP